jgi:hypothetical protein
MPQGTHNVTHLGDRRISSNLVLVGLFEGFGDDIFKQFNEELSIRSPSSSIRRVISHMTRPSE